MNKRLVALALASATTLGLLGLKAGVTVKADSFTNISKEANSLENINKLNHIKDTEKEVKNGWIYKNNCWYYFKDNNKLTNGWKLIDGKVYFFNKKGSMKTGWHIVKQGDKTFKYYLKPTGERASGWEKINNKLYYFDTEVGEMKTGWQFIDGKTYFFNKNGSMKIGWHVVKYKDKTFKYYLKPTGERASGWEKINNKLYYFDTELGAMIKSKKI